MFKSRSLYTLDVVFVVDATGSMADDINIVKENLYNIVNKLMERKKQLNLRFGMVAYRDHPPEDKTFLTKVYPPTDNIDAVLRFIKELEIGGGGDPPEAVVDGLWAAINIDWRQNAYKVIILIGDAPPHGYAKFSPPIHGVRDRWPAGCPLGLDILKVVHMIKEKADILFFVIGCNPYVHDSFLRLANEGGGKYFDIREAKQLPDVIVASLSHVLDVVDFDSKVLDYYVKHDGAFDIRDCAEDLGANIRDVKISLARLLELKKIPSWPRGKRKIDRILEPIEISSEKIELKIEKLPTAAPADDVITFNIRISNKTDVNLRGKLTVEYLYKDTKTLIHDTTIILEPLALRVETVRWRTPFNLKDSEVKVRIGFEMGKGVIKEIKQTIFLY
ncbi:MAG: vWA domain-containing protein [Candidatus Asgardarchaeia archaeon]